MYTTLSLELRDVRKKQEDKIKKDLLSDKHLKMVKKYLKEQGIELNKKEVEASVKGMIKKFGVIELIEKNYIN